MLLRKALSLLLLLLLLPTLSTRATASPAEDEYESEYEEQARVMRVSLVKGEASLRRDGSAEWERAKLNLPLVEGDTLATGRDSRLEIQVDARNFIRLGEETVLKIVTLREEGVAVSLSEGTATVRLARFERDREYFEVDAPRTTLAAEKRGLYRIDVARDGGVRVTARDDGSARIYSENSGFVLRDNRTARVAYDTYADGDWEFSAATGLDEWDRWNDDRERYLASRLRYEDRARYYDADVWGAEELDAYGDWVETKQYGYVWRPHVTVVNNYYNWAPYRYGHWRWCPPYGWTWIPEEDWGWAPYHYGRWVHYNNNWCWAPRGYGYAYRRARWRPALVAFVYIPTSYGEHVAWYPLRHGQRDPRGRWWGRDRERLAPLRAGELANLRRANPALLRAVTTAPVREFGAASLRARAATADVAERAVTGEPVRGRLPITPADVGRVAARPGAEGRRGDVAPRTGAGGRARLDIERDAPSAPPRDIPARPTGAATRTPGAPLDNELRRVRVFNGREPRGPSVSGGAVGRAGGEESTGAVRRPARPARRLPADGTNVERGTGGTDTQPVTRARPSRPERGAEEGLAVPGAESAPRVRTPVARERAGARDGDDSPRMRPVRPSEGRPTRPPVYERPEVRERPSVPEERPRPAAPREEQPSARPERPAPREERPPARVDPPPRQEPPRQEQPRQEQPPQRQEQPAPRQERQTPSAPPRSSEPRERPARPSPRDNDQR